MNVYVYTYTEPELGCIGISMNTSASPENTVEEKHKSPNSLHNAKVEPRTGYHDADCDILFGEHQTLHSDKKLYFELDRRNHTAAHKKAEEKRRQKLRQKLRHTAHPRRGAMLCVWKGPGPSMEIRLRGSARGGSAGRCRAPWGSGSLGAPLAPAPVLAITGPIPPPQKKSIGRFDLPKGS